MRRETRRSTYATGGTEGHSSAVGRCADNALVEGFFGMLKRERVNRRRRVPRQERTSSTSSSASITREYDVGLRSKDETQ